MGEPGIHTRKAADYLFQLSTLGLGRNGDT
jgi:hypothetical protein